MLSELPCMYFYLVFFSFYSFISVPNTYLRNTYVQCCVCIFVAVVACRIFCINIIRFNNKAKLSHYQSKIENNNANHKYIYI